MVLTGLVYYYSINYCFNSGSLEGKCWKDFHLFWWKIYSLTCLCIMFGTWAKRRMNVLGRENLRFSRWFSSIYVLCGSHIKHYFVETLVLRSSLPSNKSGFFFNKTSLDILQNCCQYITNWSTTTILIFSNFWI